MIASLFVLTAFAVSAMSQNATANHIPVAFTYAQNSPAKPYVATSNGLTYTAEPNDTYLWNGHYLRAPPVPYPNVPTIAPDGLPYGAIGPVGAQGIVGATNFSRGNAINTGVPLPSATTGDTRWVNVNTFWSNETINIYGNVTVQGSVTLTIYNSVIIFHESAAGSTSYGILLNNSATVFIRHGSVVEQTSASDAPYVIGNQGNFNLMITNTTFFLNSTKAPTGGPYYLNSVIANYMAYDTFIGATYSTSVSSTKGFGTSTGALLVAHDKFFHLQVSTTNPTNSTFSDVAYANYNALYNVQSNGTIAYDTFSDYGSSFNSNSSLRALNFLSHSINVTHTLLTNINESITSGTYTPLHFDVPLHGSGTPYPGSQLLFSNSTASFISNIGPVYARAVLIGDQAVDYYNITVVHSSFLNFTEKSPSDGLIAVGTIGADSLIVRYNIFDGYFKSGSVEGGWVWAGGGFVRNDVADNIFENVNGNAVVPYSANQGFSLTPPGGAYSMITSDQHPIPIGNIILSGNWFLNYSGTAVGFSMSIYANHIIIDANTFIDFNHATAGIGSSSNSGTNNSLVEDNVLYGLYNSTIGMGSVGGGANNVSYNGNSYNDVDITSFGAATFTSQENYLSQTGAYLFANTNGSYTSSGPMNYYRHIQSRIEFNGASPTSVTLWQINPADANVSGILTPSSFNFTSYDSYLPAEWTVYQPSNGSQLDPFSPFDYSGSTPDPNPSFLNLTGYLGIYPSQTYTLNASNIKGESSLPVYLAGSQIASISASSAHYNLTANIVGNAPQYTIQANNKTDDPVTLYWNNLLPGTVTGIAMYVNGNFINSTVVKANAQGVVSIMYNPATMPLDPTFILTSHSMTFSETNLPSGYTWSVVIDGYTYTADTPTITVFADNGIYSYSIPSFVWFSPSPDSGTVVIDNQNAGVGIFFTQYFTVSFVETGYTGKWSLTYNSNTYSSTTNTIIIKVPEGVNIVFINGANGYYINPISWENSVYSNQTVSVVFTLAPPNPALIFNSWDALIVLLAIGLPLLGYIVIRTQRR